MESVTIQEMFFESELGEYPSQERKVCCPWRYPGLIVNKHPVVLNLWCKSTPDKAMAPHSSTLAWKIPWMEEPGRLQSMGSRRVRHDWATSLSLFTFMHWRRKWQPTPVFLPGESQERRSLEGCHLWDHTVGHDWSNLAAAAAAAASLHGFMKYKESADFFLTLLKLLHHSFRWCCIKKVPSFWISSYKRKRLDFLQIYLPIFFTHPALLDFSPQGSHFHVCKSYQIWLKQTPYSLKTDAWKYGEELEEMHRGDSKHCGCVIKAC